MRKKYLASGSFHSLPCQIDFYYSTKSDRGWGCGYKNVQMLLSFIKSEKELLSYNNVPPISVLQECIERAWKMGFDHIAALQQGGSLKQTEKWVGTSEIASLLLSFGIRAQIFEFHTKSSGKSGNKDLFEFIWNHFTSNTTWKSPLYLQHKGHSRTVVGVSQQLTKPRTILVFDPSVQGTKLRSSLSSGNFGIVEKTLDSFYQPEYQIVLVKDKIKLTEREILDSRKLVVQQKF